MFRVDATPGFRVYVRALLCVIGLGAVGCATAQEPCAGILGFNKDVETVSSVLAERVYAQACRSPARDESARPDNAWHFDSVSSALRFLSARSPGTGDASSLGGQVEMFCKQFRAQRSTGKLVSANGLEQASAVVDSWIQCQRAAGRGLNLYPTILPSFVVLELETPKGEGWAELSGLIYQRELLECGARMPGAPNKRRSMRTLA